MFNRNLCTIYISRYRKLLKGYLYSGYRNLLKGICITITEIRF